MKILKIRMRKQIGDEWMSEYLVTYIKRDMLITLIIS